MYLLVSSSSVVAIQCRTTEHKEKEGSKFGSVEFYGEFVFTIKYYFKMS